MPLLYSLLVSRAGELATASTVFDVIAFCSGAWSWSATYESRIALLQSSQVFYSGRQAGAAPQGNGKLLAGKRTQVQVARPKTFLGFYLKRQVLTREARQGQGLVGMAHAGRLEWRHGLENGRVGWPGLKVGKSGWD